MSDTPHPKISPDQWDRWPAEAVVNTLLLSPVLYLPMALHMAWQVWDDDVDAALRIVGWPLLVAVVWVALVYILVVTVL